MRLLVSCAQPGGEIVFYLASSHDRREHFDRAGAKPRAEERPCGYLAQLGHDEFFKGGERE
jgi:hypothetical protein